MAQADYVVANGTGAAVRSDLNGQLAAIVSNNSGATEPATMYAYQWWADTTAGLLKLRNSANNAWITLRELDGTLLMEDGTAAAPGLSFASDPDSGIFRGGANEFGIATNGVERVEFGTSEVVFNDGGANYDFRIEGDTNTSLFFVDASAEAVGEASTANVEQYLRNTTINLLSKIDGTTSAQFGTETSHPLLLTTGNFERVRITSAGLVGIGTTPSYTLDVAGTINSRSANPTVFDALQFYGTAMGTDNKFWRTQISTTAQNWQTVDDAYTTPSTWLQATRNGNQVETIRFLTGTSGTTERLRIDSSGRLLVGASAAVSGADANGRVQVSQDIASNTCILVAENTASSGNLSCIRARLTNSSPNSIYSAFLQCDDSTTNRLTLRSNGGLANYSANNFNLSDRNAKKDISPAADTWDCIKEWEIVNYRYKDQSDDADLNLGVIAQQVAESCPEVITVFQEAKEATEDAPAQEERLGVREQQMYWMAIKALQEAQVRIEQLEQRLTDAGIA
jgi:hypothetical protein